MGQVLHRQTLKSVGGYTDKGLSRNDVTFLGGRGVSQKVTKSDRGEEGSQLKSDDSILDKK